MLLLLFLLILLFLFFLFFLQLFLFLDDIKHEKIVLLVVINKYS
jgi:hypothetical protein